MTANRVINLLRARARVPVPPAVPADIGPRCLAVFAILLACACPASPARAEDDCLEYQAYLRLDGFLELSAYAALDAAGGRACVLHPSGGLQVVDISNADEPVLLGGVDTPGTASQVVMAGDLAYVADGEAGLQIVDISTPQSPQIIGTLTISGGCLDVAVAGDYAFVTTSNSATMTSAL